MKFPALCLLTASLWLAGSRPASAQRPPPATEVGFSTQVQPGNIFTVGEKVQLKAEIRSGSGVKWTVKDHRGNSLATGTAEVADHQALITPDIAAAGYYVLQVASTNGAEALGEGRTTFAVVPFSPK